MKRLIGTIMIGLMILACGQVVSAGGHGGRGHGHRQEYYHGRHRGWNSWDTFGAVCAGVMGVGLIAAAFSDCGQPALPRYAYPPPPPPPPPVYRRPVYYVPVYR